MVAFEPNSSEKEDFTKKLEVKEEQELLNIFKPFKPYNEIGNKTYI